MEKVHARVGEKYFTNEGYLVEIVEYYSCENCTIQFEDRTILRNKEYGQVKNGQIKNPFHISVFGVGYYGIGNYISRINNKNTKVYQTWKSMLERCYDTSFHYTHPTYIDCYVCPEWLNFQVFAKWFEDNYFNDFVLDKDILVKGNKIYSPETCAFVPKEINSLFIKRCSKRGLHPIGVSKSESKFKSDIHINGKTKHLGFYNTPEEAFAVYKATKEAHIKEIADKWVYKITRQVYNAMYNYKVEITD